MEIGELKIEFLGHSGFIISNAKKRIAIDPYNVSERAGKVDFILITHSHYDHCSIKDITKLAKEGTIIVVSADSQSKITKIDNVEMQIIEAGEELEFDDVRVEAIPAYNIGKEFHPKKEGWLGYLVKLNDAVIYHAGDTDKIPEMINLTGYGKLGKDFVALLPVSGKYVMSAEEAAEAASLINPSLAIPMHYGAGVAGTIDDAKSFLKLCEENGINAKMLEKL